MTETIQEDGKQGQEAKGSDSERLDAMAEQLDSVIISLFSVFLADFKQILEIAEHDKTNQWPNLVRERTVNVVTVLNTLSLWKQQKTLNQQKGLLEDQKTLQAEQKGILIEQGNILVEQRGVQTQQRDLAVNQTGILTEQKGILATSQKHLDKLESDSKTIKRFTIVLAVLTLVLIIFAWKLDNAIDSFKEAIHNMPTTNKAK